MRRLRGLMLVLVWGCSGGAGTPSDAERGLEWRPDAGTQPLVPMDAARPDAAPAPIDAAASELVDASVGEDAASRPVPLPTTFAQGVSRGEDPRVRFERGHYYSVFNEGRTRKLHRSDSLLDRGPGKVVPAHGGAAFPLFAPVYIDTLNGHTYDAWFAFDTNVWRCDCEDPYDEADSWRVVKSIPLTGWSIDFEIFQVPEPSPFAGRRYLVWAGADSPSTGWGFESCFIAELLDLRPDQPTLSTLDNAAANRIASYGFDWTDVVAEAPGPAIHDGTVSIVYSGNGAHTVDYALGIVILKRGADPASATSWIDYNRGGCDGDVKNGPELARTEQVFGPGVARFTASPDGSEDWMVYHAKVFETFNRGEGTQGQQDNNEMWARYINLKAVGWRDVACAGQHYAIPDLGTPPDPGAVLALPAGDPGMTPGRRRVEAESMIPFGFVMGPTVQAIPRVNADPEVILAWSAGASNGEKVTHLDALAADSPDSPKRAGLVWRNSVAARSLALATASAAVTQLDLYVNGAFETTVTLPATGGSDAFQVTSVALAIPAGAELRLVHEAGKGAPPDLDYVDFIP
jgi:GH43 family beta-xylosidase